RPSASYTIKTCAPVLVSSVPDRTDSACSLDPSSSAKPAPRKNGQNNSRRGGDRRPLRHLSQRPKAMKAAHTPAPLVVAGERPILVSTERNIRWTNLKNRLLSASFRALALRSSVQPELASDAADVSPRVQGRPNRLL